MIKKIMATAATSMLVICLSANNALAEKHKGNCLVSGQDFDKCYVEVTENQINLEFRDSAKEAANQSIAFDTINAMTVQRVKKVTADRVLFSPVWKLKGRFSLFEITYVDPDATGAETKTMSFRVTEKRGIPLMSELEQSTGKNVEIIAPEPEADTPEEESASDKD